MVALCGLSLVWGLLWAVALRLQVQAAGVAAPGLSGHGARA